MVTLEVGTVGLKMNLLIKQGCTFAIPFASTSNGKSTGPRDDLTGAEIRAQIRKKPSSPGEPTVRFSVTVTNAAQGEFVLHLSALDTAGIPAGDFPTDPESKYHWDGEIEFPDGTVRPIAVGEVTVHAEVTR